MYLHTKRFCLEIDPNTIMCVEGERVGESRSL